MTPGDAATAAARAADPRCVRVGDLADPRLAPYREVREGPGLVARGLFVAESRLVVERLLAAGRFRVRSLLLSEAAQRALAPALAALDPELTVYVASPEAVSRLAGFPVHQGCLALAERGALPDAAALAQLAARGAGRLVALERLADPQNLGSIFRSARGFGADAVLLAPGGCDPLYRKAVRVSTGAVLELPFARAASWPGDLDRLRAEGFRVLACVTDRRARALTPELAAQLRAERLVLCFGAEGAGLSAAARARADQEVTVATAPGFDSLNVAVAAAIVLHQLARIPCAS